MVETTLVLFQGNKSGFSVHGGVAPLAKGDSPLQEEHLDLNADRPTES